MWGPRKLLLLWCLVLAAGGTEHIYRPGRRVCAIGVPRGPLSESFAQRVYQPFLTTCDGHRACSTYRDMPATLPEWRELRPARPLPLPCRMAGQHLPDRCGRMQRWGRHLSPALRQHRGQLLVPVSGGAQPSCGRDAPLAQERDSQGGPKPQDRGGRPGGGGSAEAAVKSGPAGAEAAAGAGPAAQPGLAGPGARAPGPWQPAGPLLPAAGPHRLSERADLLPGGAAGVLFLREGAVTGLARAPGVGSQQPMDSVSSPPPTVGTVSQAGEGAPPLLNPRGPCTGQSGVRVLHGVNAVAPSSGGRYEGSLPRAGHW
ncbi:epidermal growth factor-like protein 7 isoform X5 [Manis pentadactyla]|uniref:epidermal growth factor-like protein 7 isoform X5 n=1 Tax=Manis pentadactyla TaxID=143292 RepID=UPI00255CA7A9|nr:epidermal growth factor-like protein 7 isoform X5 [Manis pentadactyla]XP_057355196.1 epidermal growth factor-like protein 7 isoform X5 [Manis pentadactyla]XP_057355209.1 epidermal growth factor-like protein 7 isoform X5 [Manis pentadactyla]